MKRVDAVRTILGSRLNEMPAKDEAEVFAPSNIALCKYWGKRDAELNLPLTGSLSISLDGYGTTTKLKPNQVGLDRVQLNGEAVQADTSFFKRIVEFLDLFRGNQKWHLDIDTRSNIPVAAGLASSASGFAALVKALDQLFQWNLKEPELSILARMGSGSASRSIVPGFVEWYQGVQDDGMDSFAEVLRDRWQEFCIGLLIFSQAEKGIGSREAMQRTIQTSLYYTLWPAKVQHDLAEIKQAIAERDMSRLGRAAESNALAMHAAMLTAWPPVSYALPETVISMQKIWGLRKNGLNLFFTQDAGPNLKLLFLEKDLADVSKAFPDLKVVRPFM